MTANRNTRWLPPLPADAQPTEPGTSTSLRFAAAARRYCTGAATGEVLTVMRTVGILTTSATDAAGPDELASLALWWAVSPGVSPQQRDMFSQIAHRLTQRAYAPFVPVALAAARLRAEVLDEQGQFARAAHLWGGLIAVSQLAHNAELEQHARLAHAVDLHRAGTCGEAVNQISYLWQNCLDRPGRTQPAALLVLRLYLAMLTACGQEHERDALLAEAATLPGISSSDLDGLPDVAAEAASSGETPWLVDLPDAHQPVCAWHAQAEGEGSQ